MILVVLVKTLIFSSWFKKLKPVEGYVIETRYEGNDLIGYVVSGNAPQEVIDELMKEMVVYKTVNVDGVDYKIKSKIGL